MVGFSPAGRPFLSFAVLVQEDTRLADSGRSATSTSLAVRPLRAIVLLVILAVSVI